MYLELMMVMGLLFFGFIFVCIYLNVERKESDEGKISLSSFSSKLRFKSNSNDVAISPVVATPVVFDSFHVPSSDCSSCHVTHVDCPVVDCSSCN